MTMTTNYPQKNSAETYNDEEAQRVVLRIRGLVAEGMRTNDIAAEVGKSPQYVSNIKNGIKWTNPQIRISFLQPRFSQPNEICVKCLRESRLITKDNLCLECACLDLHKLSFLRIGEAVDKKAKEEKQG